MATRALRRLLGVLELEEEQGRLALQSAQRELASLELALTAARTRERNGRHLMVAGAISGDLADRLAGIAETAAGQHHSATLEQIIANAQTAVATLCEGLLSKRVERRRVETLITESEAKDAVEASRRNQRSLDDWYLNRFRSDAPGANTREPEAANNPSPCVHRPAHES